MRKSASFPPRDLLRAVCSRSRLAGAGAGAGRVRAPLCITIVWARGWLYHCNRTYSSKYVTMLYDYKHVALVVVSDLSVNINLMWYCCFISLLPAAICEWFAKLPVIRCTFGELCFLLNKLGTSKPTIQNLETRGTSFISLEKGSTILTNLFIEKRLKNIITKPKESK